MKVIISLFILLISTSLIASECVTKHPSESERGRFGEFGRSQVVSYKFICSIKKDIKIRPYTLGPKISFPFAATWDSFSSLTDSIAIGTEKLNYYFQFSGSTNYDRDALRKGYTALYYIAKKNVKDETIEFVSDWKEISNFDDMGKTSFEVDGVEVTCYRSLQCK